ncbi:hypothetical protein ACFX2A_041825 [Malus domestica]
MGPRRSTGAAPPPRLEPCHSMPNVSLVRCQAELKPRIREHHMPNSLLPQPCLLPAYSRRAAGSHGLACSHRTAHFRGLACSRRSAHSRGLACS